MNIEENLPVNPEITRYISFQLKTKYQIRFKEVCKLIKKLHNRNPRNHTSSSLAINFMGRKTLLRSSILVQLAFYPTITKQTVTGYQPSISSLPGLNLLLWQHQFCMAIIRIF